MAPLHHNLLLSRLSCWINIPRSYRQRVFEVSVAITPPSEPKNCLLDFKGLICFKYRLKGWVFESVTRKPEGIIKRFEDKVPRVTTERRTARLCVSIVSHQPCSGTIIGITNFWLQCHPEIRDTSTGSLFMHLWVAEETEEKNGHLQKCWLTTWYPCLVLYHLIVKE